MIAELLDLEKDLRDAEFVLSLGSRYVNCCRDRLWFDLMEEEGFLVDGKFLPLIDIIMKTEVMSETRRVFTLKSVGSCLSCAATVVLNAKGVVNVR